MATSAFHVSQQTDMAGEHFAVSGTQLWNQLPAGTGAGPTKHRIDHIGRIGRPIPIYQIDY